MKADDEIQEVHANAVVPASLLCEEKKPAEPKQSPFAGATSTPTSAGGSGFVAPPTNVAKGRYYGISSDVAGTGAAVSQATSYDSSKYSQARNGPDYGGVGSSPYVPDHSDHDSGPSALQETAWQIADAWGALKEKAGRSQESLGGKIKDFLDEL